MVKPLACACMACAPQRVLASPAAPISLSAPAAPALNVAAAETSKIAVNSPPGSSKADPGKPGAETAATAGGLPKPKTAGGDKSAEDGAAKGNSGAGQELTPEEKAQVAKLRARDREVRAHEQAHAAAGGALAGAPSYSYQTGPDGKQYAVGGEVPIRTSASSANPRQAIAQLQQVARAASAPANPSGQDRAVAAQARAQIAQIQAQLAQEAQAKAQESLESASAPEKTENAATTAPAGLPELPKLPELPAVAPVGRAPNAAPPGVAQPSAALPGAAPSAVAPPAVAPRGIGASDASLPGRGGVAALVPDRGDSDGASSPGPIEIANHNSGPIAAYQQGGAPHKPATITGRIVNLNA